MEKEFIPYSEALALKKLDFDEPCFANYYADDKSLIPYRGYPDEGDEDTNFSTTVNKDYTDKWVTAPLYQQSFRFFRDKYNLYHVIGKKAVTPFNFYYFITEERGNEIESSITDFDTHEDAELACLKKLIEIVKKNK